MITVGDPVSKNEAEKSVAMIFENATATWSDRDWAVSGGRAVVSAVSDLIFDIPKMASEERDEDRLGMVRETGGITYTSRSSPSP